MSASSTSSLTSRPLGAGRLLLGLARVGPLVQVEHREREVLVSVGRVRVHQGLGLGVQEHRASYCQVQGHQDYMTPGFSKLVMALAQVGQPIRAMLLMTPITLPHRTSPPALSQRRSATDQVRKMAPLTATLKSTSPGSELTATAIEWIPQVLIPIFILALNSFCTFLGERISAFTSFGIDYISKSVSHGTDKTAEAEALAQQEAALAVA